LELDYSTSKPAEQPDLASVIEIVRRGAADQVEILFVEAG
jgi:hypothetical protein